jgi:subtilisin family serine protease
MQTSFTTGCQFRAFKIIAALILMLVTNISFSQEETEFSIQWSDGVSAPIELMTDYVAVDVQANRISKQLKSLSIEIAPMSVGISGRGISIVKVADSTAKGVFVQTARTEQTEILGIPIRDPSSDEVGIIAIATNELIVRFNDGYSLEAINETNQGFDVEILRTGSGPFKSRYILRPKDGKESTALRLAQDYHKVDGVAYAHPNLIIEKVNRSTDPLLDAQWHLQNTGQGNGTVGADSRAREAWTTTKGAGVVIAIIDPDGVQRNHEDLMPNQFINTSEGITENGIDDDNNGLIDDWSGWNFGQNSNNPTTPRPHGTAAAGVAAAACNNGLGGCGTAPEAKILGIAQGRTVEDDANAFYYAASVGADVISNSWGYPLGLLSRPTDAVEEAIAHAATKGRDGKGAVVLFAMSNEHYDNFTGTNPDISSLDMVMAVGRSTNHDKWGKSGFGDGMALLAPTQAARGDKSSGCLPNDLAGTLDITTTDLMGNAGYNSGLPRNCVCNTSVLELRQKPSYTACFGGTSSATPLIAGIVALVLSVNPELTGEQVVEILKDSADKIERSEANYQEDSQGRDYSITHGYGRVNAVRATELAQKFATDNP